MAAVVESHLQVVKLRWFSGTRRYFMGNTKDALTYEPLEARLTSVKIFGSTKRRTIDESS